MKAMFVNLIFFFFGFVSSIVVITVYRLWFSPLPFLKKREMIDTTLHFVDKWLDLEEEKKLRKKLNYEGELQLEGDKK